MKKRLKLKSRFNLGVFAMMIRYNVILHVRYINGKKDRIKLYKYQSKEEAERASEEITSIIGRCMENIDGNERIYLNAVCGCALNAERIDMVYLKIKRCI